MIINGTNIGTFNDFHTLHKFKCIKKGLIWQKL